MELEGYGFVKAGEWYLSEGPASGITFKLTRLADRRVIYAFVVGAQVKYIGICEKATTTLKERMKRYRRRQGRKRKTSGGENTNQHKARLIKQYLEAGEPVLIFALAPERECDFFGLKVDLVKGLENPLIAKFGPEWNR